MSILQSYDFFLSFAYNSAFFRCGNVEKRIFCKMDFIILDAMDKKKKELKVDAETSCIILQLLSVSG